MFSSNNGNNYRLSNNAYCFRNNQCWSGYCDKGRCGIAQEEHDPCRPIIENCPGTLQCSTFSNTCISHSYQKQLPCKYGSDCSFSATCIRGKCVENIPPGQPCVSLRPDLCADGSKCTRLDSTAGNLRCYELCSDRVPCPKGYECIENVWNPDPICRPIKSSNRSTQSHSTETLNIVLVIIFILIILLGGLYGWIQLTRSKKDPRLVKRKKKKLILNYEGNGLATLTIVPSNSQLSQQQQPVAASQIFLNNSNPTEPPPAYSEIINIS